jgi:uncharacterized membrane protein YbjE (DUF340 family)
MLRIMASNAFLLSILYLVTGLVVELLRDWRPSRLLMRLSLSLDSLPARALEVTGLMRPLSEAYLAGRINDAWVRVIFGATTIVVIYLLALVVGLGMGSLRVWLERRALRKLGGP